jgi:Calx-beta domain/RTX calcium-binding nonapeptide repeat (4 copies)
MPFSISPLNQNVNENAGVITFTISRTSITSSETVYFSTVQNQGYTNSGDYVGRLNTAVNFGVGVSSLNVLVAISDDSVIEGNETFGVLVDTLAGTALATGKFTIIDNDNVAPATFNITPSSRFVNENAGFVDFTVSRSSTSGSNIVYFSTVQNQGFTNNNDYVGLVNQQVSFGSSETQKTVRVSILDDNSVEASETFGVIIENSAGTTLESSTFTITDNDAQLASTFAMTPAQPTVSEDAGFVDFTITRSQTSAVESVKFSTLKNQGYVNNGDYTGLIDQSVSFAIGENSQTVRVSITDDLVQEGSEKYGAIIEGSSGQSLDTSTFTITDNDATVLMRGTSITGGDILSLASQHIGELWGRSNCTGFVYTVANESGNEFFDHRATSRLQTGRFGASSNVLLNNSGSNEYGFVVPIRDISNGAAANPADAFSDPRNPDYQWQLEGSTGGNVTAPTFRGFQPGDLFRGRAVGNNGYEVMHSGVVSSYDSASNKLWLIDNFLSGATSAAIRYTDFIVDPSATARHIGSQFAIYRLKSSGDSTNHAVYGGNEDDVLGGGAAADTILGYAGGDTLSGNSGNDFLVGASGNDKLSGDAGNDVVLLGDGDDTGLTGSNNGTDYIYGGLGNDMMTGSSGTSDILLGEQGNDTIFGGDGGANYIFGGSGANVLTGGSLLDVFISEGSSDTISAGANGSYAYRYSSGISVVTGGVGIDQFIGGIAQSNDTINAGDGSDYLFGGSGNDVLRGEVGNDVIIGQDGNDTLEGGAGVNLLWANDAGSDQIRVSVSDGGTQVVEFFEAGGTNDIVQLLNSTLTSFAGYEALRANMGSVVGNNLLYNTASGAQLYLNLGANQTAIWFQGVSAYSLTSSDFLFA